MALSPDGCRLAVASAAAVTVYDLDTGWPAFRLEGPLLTEPPRPGREDSAFPVPTVFTPDGKHLLTADRSAFIRVWDADTGRRLPDLPANRGGVDALAVSADGSACATTGHDAVIRRLDLKTGRALPCGDGFLERVAVALSPDGKLAAGGDPTGLLRVWAAPFTGAPRTLRRNGPDIQDLCFSPDGTRLFVACSGRSVEVWDPAGGTVTTVLCGPAGAKPKESTQLALSPDGRRLVGSVPWEAVWAWDLRSGRLLWQRRLERKGKGGPGSRAVFTAGGAEILTGGQNARVIRLDAATGRECGGWAVPTEMDDWPVRQLAVTPDGRWVAAVPAFNVGETPPFVEPPGPSHHDCELVLFEPATGRVGWRKRFALHESIRALAFVPTGKWLLTAHRDGRIRGWERATGRLAFERVGPRGYVGWLHISADGRLAAANAAGAVGYVWSLTPE